MYSLKPILVNQNIDLPTCMYKLKPINMDVIGNMPDSINNSVSEGAEKSFVGKFKIFGVISQDNEKLMVLRYQIFRERVKWSYWRRSRIESSRSWMSSSKH